MTRVDRDQDTLAEMKALGSDQRAPGSSRVSAKKDTMWEARLILSTLDPRGVWAGRLRLAIRQGDRAVVDEILAAVYQERETVDEEPVAEEPTSEVISSPASSRPIIKCTVLPPPTRSLRRVS